MKLKEIIHIPYYDLNRITGKELRSAYTRVRASLNSRIGTFERHGNISGVPSKLREGLPTISSGLSDKQMQDIIASAGAWMRGANSTNRGYENMLMQRAEDINNIVGEDIIKSKADLDRYGRFMGEMQKRAGEMWKHDSATVREMYFQARRLGVDENKFLQNYEYWASNLDKLVDYEGDLSGMTTAGIQKKLKLESIKEYYKEAPGRGGSARYGGRKRK